MALDVQKEVNRLQQTPIIGKYLGPVIQKMSDAINNLATNTATDATNAKMQPPAPIQGLTVKTDGNGTVHAVINDGAAIQRGIHYFIEYSTDSGFFGAHVVHLGTSRTMSPITLPAFDDNGNPQTWHFRGYNQYPGSDPSRPVNFGGTSPTPVAVGGNVKLTLLSSTGSGTAQNTGQQAGSGFGKILYRSAQGPKRST